MLLIPRTVAQKDKHDLWLGQRDPQAPQCLSRAGLERDLNWDSEGCRGSRSGGCDFSTATALPTE